MTSSSRFKGDSGSGLYYNGTVIGIASYAPFGCAQDFPDVFTNVFQFLTWINETMDFEESI